MGFVTYSVLSGNTQHGGSTEEQLEPCGGQYLKGCMESLLPGQAASLHQDLQGYCRGGALGRQFNSRPRRIILWICFLGLTWKLTTKNYYLTVLEAKSLNSGHQQIPSKGSVVVAV